VDRDLPFRRLEGEEILWSGRPAQGVMFYTRDWLLVPFSLMFGGFAVFWEAIVVRSGAPGFFPLWGMMFLLAGLYFIAGRFAVDAWARGKTRYVVTNRRILILRSGPFAKLTSLGLDRLPDIQLSEDADRRGTIRFGRSMPLWGWGSFVMWTPALDPTPQFIAIDDAESVFDLVQRASRAAT
jgi:hypothetical protein